MHICHIVFRFDIGGLENGIINILNQLPSTDYKHSIVCLSDYNPDFFQRIQAENVAIYALNKRPGKDFGYLKRLYHLLRQIRPDVVHSRNLNTLECQAVSWIAGVRHRIHGEHGWDSEQAKTRYKPILIRKLFSPLISHYVALSGETEHYLTDKVGITDNRIQRICNGVNTDRFSPSSIASPTAGPTTDQALVIGTVGRLASVKNQQLLVRAFANLLRDNSPISDQLRLIIAGDGPCRQQLLELVKQLQIEESVSLPGACNDVPALMSSLSLYVQPSLAEGISNTILESMASGLAVVTTDVGGARELVHPGYNGEITENNHLEQLTAALQHYVDDPQLLRQHGSNSRALAVNQFSIDTMAGHYDGLYQRLTQGRKA
ncbi:MAG: TIGR03088 family PEP-CTERM/XrtA system glycosyltransferase [Motiliproteus sp.]